MVFVHHHQIVFIADGFGVSDPLTHTVLRETVHLYQLSDSRGSAVLEKLWNRIFTSGSTIGRVRSFATGKGGAR